jgi:hypothetical protein
MLVLDIKDTLHASNYKRNLSDSSQKSFIFYCNRFGFHVVSRGNRMTGCSNTKKKSLYGKYQQNVVSKEGVDDDSSTRNVSIYFYLPVITAYPRRLEFSSTNCSSLLT